MYSVIFSGSGSSRELRGWAGSVFSTRVVSAVIDTEAFCRFPDTLLVGPTAILTLKSLFSILDPGTP